jgi:hypothetical protein
LVLDYLTRSRRINPELQMKAEQYINLGYQRLLTFEVSGGGFDWSGSPPAKNILTAYGLLEIVDMAKVHEVDPALIERTRKWLLSRQNGDGSWDLDYQMHTWSGVQAKLPVTALATWSLAETSLPVPEAAQAVKKGLGFLGDHLDEATDPYVLALCANALVAGDRQGRVTEKVLETLVGQVKEDEKAAWWVSQTQTATYSQGQTADIETTALTAYALLKHGRHGALINKALTYLIRQKDSFGTWHSTQATILALKALITSLTASVEDNRGTVTVLINGEEAGKVEITPDNSDVLQLIDLQEQTQEGDNRVALRVGGTISALYQMVGKYYLPWNLVPPEAEKEFLDIDLNYDKTELRQNDLLTANVKITYHGPKPTFMVLVDLGIPPGFQVLTEDLDGVRAEGVIDRYDVTGRQVIVYLGTMMQGKTVEFNYRLRAKFPIRAKTPRSRVYEYYSPEHQDVAQPVEIVVTT